jgi:transposase InsO family protein
MTMPWKECSVVSERLELVSLMRQPAANVTELCRRFGVSRKSAYKWLKRFEHLGASGLCDQSREPRSSPRRTPEAMEERLLALRQEHPAWGPRKLRRYLADRGVQGLPAVSTIEAILGRNGLIGSAESRKHHPLTRFEYPFPNALWQMDFKGHFALVQGRCHPLCVLDDHSRYATALAACAHERQKNVQQTLTSAFRRYGLPEAMLMDNGSAWASHTQLTVWLLRLGITVRHGRPAHPQTQGKLERFNRTLAAEVIGTRVFGDLQECQSRFDQWREIYNLQRPHEALDLACPVTRYKPSDRPFPEMLAPIDYPPGDLVLTTHHHTGQLVYKGRRWNIGCAFAGLPVAVRPSSTDGLLHVFFCHQKVAEIDLRQPREV